MKTKPNTPEREAEVDIILSGVRKRLVSGNFREITISYGFLEVDSDGQVVYGEETGDFTIHAIASREGEE